MKLHHSNCPVSMWLITLVYKIPYSEIFCLSINEHKQPHSWTTTIEISFQELSVSSGNANTAMPTTDLMMPTGIVITYGSKVFEDGKEKENLKFSFSLERFTQ